MKKLFYILIIVFVSVGTISRPSAQEALVWPAAPDRARIAYVGSIDCEDLEPGKGLFGKLSRLVGGRSASDDISLPFSPLVVGNDLFLVCQNIAALIRVDRRNHTFRLIEDEMKTLRYPIGLCRGLGDDLYLSDSEAGAIYRYSEGKLAVLINNGLSRPTGIAFDQRSRTLYVVNTGEHKIVVFDLDGSRVRSFPDRENATQSLNFPIFVAVSQSGDVFVNDALNFQIKRFSADGSLIGSFGFEGDAPGAFARPKGIALDSEDHVYVVDNLFDNFQVFDNQGSALLAVGSAGQARGEFWSPAGIDIVADTLFIADTFNNRIQMFQYLGDAR